MGKALNLFHKIEKNIPLTFQVVCPKTRGYGSQAGRLVKERTVSLGVLSLNAPLPAPRQKRYNKAKQNNTQPKPGNECDHNVTTRNTSKYRRHANSIATHPPNKKKGNKHKQSLEHHLTPARAFLTSPPPTLIPHNKLKNLIITINILLLDHSPTRPPATHRT